MKYEDLINFNIKRYSFKQFTEDDVDIGNVYSYRRGGKLYIGGVYDQVPEESDIIGKEDDNVGIRYYYQLLNKIPKKIKDFINFDYGDPSVNSSLERSWYADKEAKGNNASEIYVSVSGHSEGSDYEKIVFRVDYIGTENPTKSDIGEAKDAIKSSMKNHIERAIKLIKREKHEKKKYEVYQMVKEWKKQGKSMGEIIDELVKRKLDHYYFF